MSIDSINTSASESLLIEVEESNSSQSPEEQLKNLLVDGASKENAVSLFKQFFGENLVSRAIPLSYFDSLPAFLEKTDSLYLLARVGNSVTIDDLDECVAELKSGSHTKLILNTMEKNGKAIAYSRLWWAGSARNLSLSDMQVILDLFRSPLQQLDPLCEIDIEKEVSKISLLRAQELKLLYTTYNYQIHQIAQDQSAASNPYFHLAHREPMAKLVAYADPCSVTKGLIVPCIDEQTGQVVYYELSEQIHKKGLHGYFFTPLQSRENLPAKLLFRGTDDLESVKRDFDSKGIGKTIYDEHASEILAMTNTYLKETKVPKIEIIGHSLGAVDAQRAMLSFLQPSLPHRFKEMTLFGFCSPKLDIATANLIGPYLDELSNNKIQPKLQIIYANHEKDFLTLASDVHLSGSLDHHIPTKCFYVKSDSNFRQVTQHHTHPFFNLGHFDQIDNRTWEYHDFLSKSDLEMQIQQCETRLQELEKYKSELEQQEQCFYGYLLTLKGYFVTVENSKDVQKTIERIQNRLESLLIEKEKLESNANTVYTRWSIEDTINSFIRILSSDRVQNTLNYYMSYFQEE